MLSLAIFSFAQEGNIVRQDASFPYRQRDCCVRVRTGTLRPGNPAVQVAETAVQFFITGDRPNVAGLVLAGSAEFKSELSESDMFDQRLKAAVLAVVDVSYGK